MAKPFVKWAGGKGNLLKQLEQLLPDNFDEQQNVTYIEPFVGGGAMLFHMLTHHKNIRRVVINDINADLIRCYQLIKNNPLLLIDKLRELENLFYLHEFIDRKELFYIYRDRYNQDCLNQDERAVLFLFLNRTCFNGLYRVNASGKFNVPYGRYKKPLICNEELIMEDHRLLNSVDAIIRASGDYTLVARHLGHRGLNFVYFDPPYRPLSDTSSFNDYTKEAFNDDSQVRLKEFCDQVVAGGHSFMLSNSDCKGKNEADNFFDVLYADYHIDRVMASRNVNANGAKRGKISELLVHSYRNTKDHQPNKINDYKPQHVAIKQKIYA